MIHVFSHPVFDFSFSLSHILDVACFALYAIDQIGAVACYIVFGAMFCMCYMVVHFARSV